MKYDAAFRRLFWSRVCKSKKGKRCWNWTRGTGGHGYGQVYGLDSAAPALAHRVAWELSHGRKVPAGKHVLHDCDNTICCRPSHLYLGTDVENGKDRARAKLFKGSRNPAAKLTLAVVRKIRKRVASGETQIAVAKDVGISQQSMSDIVLHKRWKEDTS